MLLEGHDDKRNLQGFHELSPLATEHLGTSMVRLERMFGPEQKLVWCDIQRFADDA